MTEAEWLESNRPLAMLRYLLDAAGPRGYPDRKFRLFACASVRRMELLLSDRRSWQAVATAERWWAFARTWLFTELQGGEEIGPAP